MQYVINIKCYTGKTNEIVKFLYINTVHVYGMILMSVKKNKNKVVIVNYKKNCIKLV